MRYAIIADIHANLEAFEVVLKDIKEQRCTHHVCLGDVVGYGASPKECLDIVRDMGIPCVKGNHDEYCSNDAFAEGFNPLALEAVAWTRQQLSAEDRNPQSFLTGDSNILGGGGGFTPHWNAYLGDSIDATWDGTLHRERGHIARSDGSVQRTTTFVLRDQISAAISSGVTNVIVSKPQGVY